MKKYKLGEIATIISGVSYNTKDIIGDGIRILRGGNIQENDLKLEDNDVFLPYSYKNANNQIQWGDTIIVASTGSSITLGKVATCFADLPNTQIGAFLRIIRPKDKKWAMLISMWLHSSTFKDYILKQAKGTSINNIRNDYLEEFTILCSENEINEISGLYLNIANKIALNRAINHNLEAMAKQLYDYWFVQFDFPDENGKPYKSSGGKMVWNEKLKREIPEGWEVKSIFEAISVQYGFPFSTEQFTEERTNVQVVRIRDILEGTTSAYSLEDTDEKYRLNEGDVLVGMDGNFHINFWHNNEAYLNQRCVRLRPYSDSDISSIQILHSISPYIKAKEQNAKGSTVGHLSDKDLKGLNLVQSINTMHFNSRKTLDGLLSLIIRNKKEILSLTTLRDSLLPLLMNGQVSLNYDLPNSYIYSLLEYSTVSFIACICSLMIASE